MSEHLAGTVLDVLRHISRWEVYLQLFATSARAQDANAVLFAHTINFLIRTTLRYDRPRVGEQSVDSHEL